MKIQALIVATFLTILSIAIPSAKALPLDKTPKDVDNALAILDMEMTRAPIYMQAFNSAANNIHRQLESVPTAIDSARIYEQLALHYMSNNIDSIFQYLNMAKHTMKKEPASVTNDSMRTAIDMRIASYMPALGIQDDAIRIISEIDTTSLSTSLKILYYESSERMWRYVRDATAINNEVRQRAIANVKMAQLHHIALLPHDTPDYMLARGKQFFERHDYTKAQPIFDIIIENEPDTSHIYAVSAFYMAHIAQADNDINGYKYFLTKSSIADIRSCILENSSLRLLGQQMFEDGDIDRAQMYLNRALANAIACNTLGRTLETARIIPLVHATHENELADWRNRFYLMIGIAIMILISLIAALLCLRHESKKVDLANKRHNIALKSKDVYVNEFVNLCALFNASNQLCRNMQRKASSGKTEELLKLLKGNKEIDENIQKFYDMFDNTFLLIYPEFPKQVNALLRPDEQIETPENGHLNTELRILAFMRMGITEATRMAQVLNYSVNTIYTYRNRLRNKAINRDTFEDDITEIDPLG